jgi:hypothetical protein
MSDSPAVQLPFPVPYGMGGVIQRFGFNHTTELSKGNCVGDPTWEHNNLVVLRNVNGTGCNVQLHHELAPLFRVSLAEAMAAAPDYKIRMLGGYCARHQRNDPDLPLSIHSFGAAFDINWDKNLLTKSKPVYDIPDAFISALTKRGWEWGGNWKTVFDCMHFQYATGC